MIQKISYQDEAEREQVLQDMTSQGYRLIEELNVLEGNFLVFTNEPCAPPTEESVTLTFEEQTKKHFEEIEDVLLTLMFGGVA